MKDRTEYYKEWREKNHAHIQQYKKEYAKTHDSSFKKMQQKNKQLQQENERLNDNWEFLKNYVNSLWLDDKGIVKRLRDRVQCIEKRKK